MAKPGGAPWWAHVMLYAGGLTMVAAGATAAVTGYAVHTANTAVEGEEILENRAELDVENLEGPLNILVLGVDEQGGSKRSDTMIMVHLNKDLDEATMVSLPRDLWVDIPDCGPGYDNQSCTFKLNHAASISDDWDETRANVVQTIDDLTGVRFHIGATVNFEGFLEMVDLVGKIELCPWHEITSHHTDKVFPEGCAYYGKTDALDLVRQRYPWDDPEDWENGLGGDYGRQAMQQQAIKSLLTEAKKQGFHKDPTKIAELLEGFGDSLTLDLPDDLKVTDLAANLQDLDPNKLNNIQVPSSTETLYPDGEELSIVQTHEGEEQEAADALWKALQDDTVDEWMEQYPEWVKQTN